ncbi:MAG: hypothetical protein JHC26_11845 [Thermofilum sp.]|jgi:hypothetical protein|uniref:hypothetical protein n=1 Tax=Thermofilum sp. TaxID=1961369 RepID=UPI00258787BB|nr:hypothetical protein [Thermofilum sp.]MCI4409776.1 hypothetical protein [Thermofilum sp.]
METVVLKNGDGNGDQNMKVAKVFQFVAPDTSEHYMTLLVFVDLNGNVYHIYNRQNNNGTQLYYILDRSGTIKIWKDKKGHLLFNVYPKQHAFFVAKGPLQINIPVYRTLIKNNELHFETKDDVKSLAFEGVNILDTSIFPWANNRAVHMLLYFLFFMDQKVNL